MKKTGRFMAALLLCMLVCTPAFAKTAVSGNAERGFLLFDDETYEIYARPGQYSSLHILQCGLIAARTPEGWFLLEENGKSADGQIWEDICEQGGMLLLKKDGMYGVYGAGQEQIYGHAYTQIVSNGEGAFLAIKTEPNDERGDGVYYLDGKGGEQPTGTVILYGLNDFSCARSLAVGSGGKKTGYLAPDGTWAISAQYGHATAFVSQGAAIAAADSGAGVIDVNGNWLISPKYETISLTQGNAVLAVTVGERLGLYDVEKQMFITEINGGGVCARTRDLKDMAIVTADGTATLYARDGSILTQWPEESGAAAQMLGGEHLLLYMDGVEYLLDKSGKTLAGPYEKIALLEENVFAARGENGCDLINGAGEILAQTSYEDITPGTEGIYIGWQAEKWEWIGADGKQIHG